MLDLSFRKPWRVQTSVAGSVRACECGVSEAALYRGVRMPVLRCVCVCEKVHIRDPHKEGLWGVGSSRGKPFNEA